MQKSKEELIKILLENLFLVNSGKGFPPKELQDFIDSQEKRYKTMTEFQLRNMVAINF